MEWHILLNSEDDDKILMMDMLDDKKRTRIGLKEHFGSKKATMSN